MSALLMLLRVWGVLMSEAMSAEPREHFGALIFAHEFLKVTRGVMKEQNRENGLPPEVSTIMANAYLEEIMTQYGLDPESLVWGLVQVVELMLKFAGANPEELSTALDAFIEWVKKNPQEY